MTAIQTEAFRLVVTIIREGLVIGLFFVLGIVGWLVCMLLVLWLSALLTPPHGG